MGRLDSDKVDRALRSKMKAERLDRGDWYYKIYDEQGFISSTSLSKGSKETLRDNRVAEMRRQLGLDTSQQLIDLVECRLSGEDALKIMRRNCPPGTSRRDWSTA
jgi:hypothetical protein